MIQEVWAAFLVINTANFILLLDEKITPKTEMRMAAERTERKDLQDITEPLP